jgi:hypothetical protein
MEEDYFPTEDADVPPYRGMASISSSELTNGLCSLELFGTDPYLRMQSINLSATDQFIMGLEYDALEKYYEIESTAFSEILLLSALSQMWIFSAYELLRTWRERAKDVVKWCNNGGLGMKIESLEKKLGYTHFGRQALADQLRKVELDPSIKEKILTGLRITHIPFVQIEHIRVALAKHEVSHKAKRTPAYNPGYGRLNMWCGSLEYELSTDSCVFGNISRRDISDTIRTFCNINDVPSDDDIATFDRMMKDVHRSPENF